MRTRTPSPRRVAIALALAIGMALGFGGYHALRALDFAEASTSDALHGSPIPVWVG